MIIILAISLLTLTAKSQSTLDIFDACRTGNLAAVEELYKINPDTVDSRDYKGYTPLILAVYNNQAEVVDYLLSKKARTDAQDNSGNTALMGATFKGYVQYVEKLLIAEATVDQQNYNGATALTFAATFGRAEIAKLLLEHKANPLLPDIRGKSPVDHAIMQDNEDMVRIMKSYF